MAVEVISVRREAYGRCVTKVTDVPDAYILGEGYATYELAGSKVRIGPGFRQHTMTAMHRAKPRLEGLSVYMTGFTPLKQTIKFTAAKMLLWPTCQGGGPGPPLVSLPR